MKYFFILAAFIYCLTIPSCLKNHRRDIIPAIYYWKVNFLITSNEIVFLKSINIKKMYVKFFDVDWNSYKMNAEPAGDLIITTDSLPFEIIPTVFITNRTLANIKDSLINTLSENIYNKIFGKLSLFKKPIVKEIQLDCDWNQNTKEKYFRLIKLIKKRADKINILLSATIRLHQVKYSDKTGVPPVDRGMLMFYNMSSVSEYKTANSIFDLETAKGYLENFNSYPLYLDVVLPAFSWGALFRSNKLIALINDLKKKELFLLKFKEIGKNRFLSTENHFLRGRYIKKNDVVRLEEISPTTTKEAAELIASHIKNNSPTIAIYNFNKELFKNYGKEDFKNIFFAFN